MKRLLALAAVVLMGPCAGLALPVHPALAGEATELADSFAAFDASHPGRGPDLGRPEIEDHAMAYALYGSAAAVTDRLAEARVAGDWLAGHAKLGDGTGWGLTYAWDAFADGSTNPVTTIYGITTALAVRSLLDVSEATGEDRYAKVAEAALDTYATRQTATANGLFFWYSDQPADAIEVHNVSSMLMGQYARAGVRLKRPGFAKLADAAYRELLSARRTSSDEAYWSYSAQPHSRPNDLVHASYIVQGLLDYQRARGQEPRIGPELAYLTGFATAQCATEFNVALHKGACAKPARLWGVGMAIATLADAGRGGDAARFAQLLAPYRISAGHFGATPNARNFLPRAVSHVLFGLAQLNRAGATPTAP